MAANRVMAIDPGTAKCGVAVVDGGQGVLAQSVIPVSAILTTVTTLSNRFSPDLIVIGSGTGSTDAVRALSGLSIPVRVVDEAKTSERARERYFREHPPRGWRRLIPRGLLSPPEPYDDLAAVLLAEAALTRGEGGFGQLDLGE